MDYSPEGTRKLFSRCTPADLQRALTEGTVLESRALSFDSDKQLHFRLGGFDAVMPHDECAQGAAQGLVRDIALVTRVGRPVCFIITGIQSSGDFLKITLSRARAQQRCQQEYLNRLCPGDIIPCRVTHLEKFGAFCDIGCGISALLPIDCISVSRISHPADRIREGEDIFCAVRERDAQGRIVLTMKELLGTWTENASRFHAGETVVGIVRSTEPYGIFIELAPNLSGLAESDEELAEGQLVSVYIKNILPEKMKIKLAVLQCSCCDEFVFPLEYRQRSGHISRWIYSPEQASRLIETVFDR